MNIYVMPELTKEEIRRMTKTVVQGVAAKKIVSSGAARCDEQPIRQASVFTAGEPRGDAGCAARNAAALSNSRLAVSRELAVSALSHSRGRQILKDAFKKIR